jgi:hypothetical protein
MDDDLSSKYQGVRVAFQQRWGLSGLSISAALAGRISMSPLRGWKVLAFSFDASCVRRLWTSNVRDRGHDLPGYADPAGRVVPGDMVGHEPEKRGECSGPAASAWLG